MGAPGAPPAEAGTSGRRHRIRGKRLLTVSEVAPFLSEFSGTENSMVGMSLSSQPSPRQTIHNKLNQTSRWQLEQHRKSRSQSRQQFLAARAAHAKSQPKRRSPHQRAGRKPGRSKSNCLDVSFIEKCRTMCEGYFKPVRCSSKYDVHT